MKTVISTEKAPAAIGPYSQGIQAGSLIITSGQLPIDPATGAIVAGGAAEQAEQCFKNIQAVVESIGHDMNDIIRVSLFLADIMDLNAVEKVQASFFPTYQPARPGAAVDALPQGALVFIEALVDNGEGTQSVPQAGDLVKQVCCCCGGSADKKNDLFCARHGGEILSVHSELTSQFRIILGIFFALVYADSHGRN